MTAPGVTGVAWSSCSIQAKKFSVCSVEAGISSISGVAVPNVILLWFLFIKRTPTPVASPVLVLLRIGSALVVFAELSKVTETLEILPPEPLLEFSRSQWIKWISTAIASLWCAWLIWLVETWPSSTCLSMSFWLISHGASMTSLWNEFHRNLHQQHKQWRQTIELLPWRSMFSFKHNRVLLVDWEIATVRIINGIQTKVFRLILNWLLSYIYFAITHWIYCELVMLWWF